MYITTPSELKPAERQKIVSYLKQRPVGVLATVDEHGKPHASAIYVTVDDDLRLTFTTKEGTHKYRDIKRHNVVSLVVFDAGNQSEVQVAGKAIEVHGNQEEQEIYRGTLEATEKTGDDVVPPIAKIPAGNYVAFVIEIDSISLSEYGWGDTFKQAMEHAADQPVGGDPA